MKKKIYGPWIRFVFLACFMLTTPLILPAKAFATNDLDDVEADVDSVTSESEAEQNEAQDAKKRADKEKENLAKAKKEALDDKHQEQVKGDAAKKEIAKLDANVQANKLQRAKYEKDKAWSLRVMAKVQARVDQKKATLTQASADLAAAKTEKETQDKSLADLRKAEKTTADSIVADHLERDKLVKEIAGLKQNLAQAQARLERERQAAHAAADQKEKLKAERDETKRKISSVPNKVIVRSPKYNCDVTETAADGGAKIGTIKVGAKYDLYRITNGRWVELQIGGRTGYAAKTCF